MKNLARRKFSMKRSRFTDQQIAFALQQAEQGTQVAEVTRKMGISEQTFYRWKKKFGGLMPSEVRKLRQLRRRTPGCAGWWRISPWTRRCSRSSSEKSSKACSDAGHGGVIAHLLPGKHPAGNPDSARPPRHPLLSVSKS
jgi:putative transposase